MNKVMTFVDSSNNPILGTVHFVAVIEDVATSARGGGFGTTFGCGGFGTDLGNNKEQKSHDQ